MTGGMERAECLLKELFSHSMRHPEKYSDWRRTLTVFAYAVGVGRETIEDAHEAAREEAEQPSAADELVEALELAEEYADHLPFPEEADS